MEAILQFAKFTRTTLLVALACWLAGDPLVAKVARAALLLTPELATMLAALAALALAIAAVALHHATWAEPPVSNVAMLFNLLGMFVWGLGVVWCVVHFMLEIFGMFLKHVGGHFP